MECVVQARESEQYVQCGGSLSCRLIVHISGCFHHHCSRDSDNVLYDGVTERGLSLLLVHILGGKLFVI